MTIIDWTKPMETVEDPPCPVRVLATDNTIPGFPIVVLINGVPLMYRADGTTGPMFTAIRNVPEPKSIPELREAWVVWDETGTRREVYTSTERRARDAAAEYNGVYARAAIMSDGSPAHGDICEDCAQYLVERDNALAEIQRLTSACDELQRERDRWKIRAETWERSLDAEVDGHHITSSILEKYESQIAAIHPVVEAAEVLAEALGKTTYNERLHDKWNRLINALKTCRNTLTPNEDHLQHQAR